jgi:hypothetical protein
LNIDLGSGDKQQWNGKSIAELQGEAREHGWERNPWCRERCTDRKAAKHCRNTARGNRRARRVAGCVQHAASVDPWDRHVTGSPT